METHRLNEDKKRFEPLRTDCAFCSNGAKSLNMEDSHFAPVYLTRDRTNLLVYRNVKFNEIHIGVPRCPRCCRVHSNLRSISAFSMILGILLVFVIPVTIAVKFDTSTFGMVLLLCATFALVYLAHLGLEKGLLSLYKVKSEKDGAKEEPLICEFVRNGWSLNRPLA